MATEEERTFNEAMNEWAAKQSFFHNPRNRLVHPDPSHPLPFRILGYLVRLGVVGLVLWGLSGLVISLHIKGKGFSQMLNDKLAEHLGADDHKGKTFAWKDGRATCKRFEASGSDSAFYKQLTAQGLSFEIPKKKMFSKAWDLEGVRIAELEMLLRVGRSSGLAGAGLPSGERPMAAGFGIDPDFRQLRYEQIDIDEATFLWGVSSTTRGQIASAPMLAVPPRASGGSWKLSFKGGALTQNWWRDVALQSLEVEVKPDRLVLSNGSLGFSKPGDTKLTGELLFGAVPQAKMNLSVSGAQIETFCPQAFRRFIGGEVNASIAIDGSPNTRTGLGSKSTIEFVDANLRDIPIFQALSMLLDSSRLRMLPLSGGTATFETGGGVLNITDIDIVSEGVGKLRGELKVTEVADDTLPEGGDGLGSVERAALASRSKVGIADWEFSGELRFGVQIERFPALEKTAAKGLFKPAGDGHAWITIPLKGTLDQLTKPQHDAIVRAIRDSG